MIIILLLGTLIFLKTLPFFSGILGAMTIYILLRNQMLYLTEKKRMKRSIMAILLLCETILCFLIPLSLVVWVFVNKLQAINLDPHSLVAPVEHVADLIQEKVGYDVLSRENIDTILSVLPKIGQVLMGSISSFAINVVVLLFVLYFMLIGGKSMEAYVNDLLPFNQRNKKNMLHEFNMIVKSNAIGIPLLAVIQGAIAMVASEFLHGLRKGAVFHTHDQIHRPAIRTVPKIIPAVLLPENLEARGSIGTEGGTVHVIAAIPSGRLVTVMGEDVSQRD